MYISIIYVYWCNIAKLVCKYREQKKRRRRNPMNYTLVHAYTRIYTRVRVHGRTRDHSYRQRYDQKTNPTLFTVFPSILFKSLPTETTCNGVFIPYHKNIAYIDKCKMDKISHARAHARAQAHIQTHARTRARNHTRTHITYNI